MNDLFKVVNPSGRKILVHSASLNGFERLSPNAFPCCRGMCKFGVTLHIVHIFLCYPGNALLLIHQLPLTNTLLSAVGDERLPDSEDRMGVADPYFSVFDFGFHRSAIYWIKQHCLCGFVGLV